MQHDYAVARRRMVEEQIVARGIWDPRLLRAFQEAPRHIFMDEAFWSQAYEDRPVNIGEQQTISQPYMVALMTDALALTGREKVLEIGTGSGYQAAILGCLAGEVYSIERFPRLSARAQKALQRLQLFNVTLRVGDGTKGWPEQAPFDGIVVTAGGPSVPPAYFEQLAEGGRLVIPTGDRYLQNLKRYTRIGDDFREEDLGGCRFVPLVGEHGW